MKNLSNTNYGRKLLFNRILSKELAAGNFRVEASYESTSRQKVVSACVSDKAIRIKVNISFDKESFFSDCDDPMELSLIYRAYFIAAYIKCLENAKEAVPDSYFEGIVTLDAIYDLVTGKRAVLCNPDLSSRVKSLRPVDVHCAIRAMTRLLIEFGTALTETATFQCEKYIDCLIDYTSLPEVEYNCSKYAFYTVLNETAKLKKLISEYPYVTEKFALFSSYAITSDGLTDVGSLLSLCDEKGGGFIPAMLMRMFAFSAEDNQRLKGVLSHRCVIESYQDFCRSSVLYYSEDTEKSILLKENWRAIQNIAERIEKLMYDEVQLQSGAVHFAE